MIGASQLAMLPKGSFLVNTSRGAIVDVSAVIDSLGQGYLAGAGIDVLEQEPPPPTRRF